jgi:hypothetical protein
MKRMIPLTLMFGVTVRLILRYRNDNLRTWIEDTQPYIECQTKGMTTSFQARR